jgi:phosphoribosylformimino-5-aminoimidazole carboxamide ribotide isomerase
MSQSFSIIPVLDLKVGEVVHARSGDRARYRPLRSPLVASSAPEDVVAGLLSLAPFRLFYIADLDAIQGTGDHRAIIAALMRRFAGIAFWVDGGFTDAASVASAVGDGVFPVLGSETAADLATVEAATAAVGKHGYALSLDYRAGGFLGPPELEASPEAWPITLIAMTLDRVGGGSGPDFERLAGIAARAGARQIYSAGGTRNRGDLERLRAMGVQGALIASALHDGRLSAHDLALLR